MTTTTPSPTKAVIFLQNVWKAFVNPVTIISFIGPLIVNSTFIALAYRLSRLDSNSKYFALKNSVEDIWVRSLIDFNIQYIVLLIAFILIIVNIISLFSSSLGNSNKQVSNLITNLKNDPWFIGIGLISVVLIALMCYLFISGSVATTSTIELYKENIEKYGLDSGIHPPPWTSPITWLRFLLAFYGFIFAFIFENTLRDHF